MTVQDGFLTSLILNDKLFKNSETNSNSNAYNTLNKDPFYPDDRNRTGLRNVCTDSPNYTVSHTLIPHWYTQPWLCSMKFTAHTTQFLNDRLHIAFPVTTGYLKWYRLPRLSKHNSVFISCSHHMPANFSLVVLFDDLNVTIINCCDTRSPNQE